LVEDAGYMVLGPERSVAEARKALGRMKVDLALLDVSLGGETVFPVSKLLEGMRIPFIFVTGNPTLLPAEYEYIAGALWCRSRGRGIRCWRLSRRSSAATAPAERSREYHGTSPRIVITARPSGSGRGICRSYGA
jgi:hypothetical protein